MGILKVTEQLDHLKNKRMTGKKYQVDSNDKNLFMHINSH